MPYAVTHVLFTIIIVSIIRDYFVTNKKNFPLHYVLIAGIAALLPDIDVPIWWILSNQYALLEIHRTFSHTLFVPFIFLLLGFFTTKVKSSFLAKHRLKLNIIFYIIALGTFIHLIQDVILIGKIMPFYPFSTLEIGLELVPVTLWGYSFLAGIDAILLIAWLIYIEIKHRISDFI